MVPANFSFYLNFSRKKNIYKNQKLKKIKGQIRGENIGGVDEIFFKKPCPLQRKSEMAPLSKMFQCNQILVCIQNSNEYSILVIIWIR